MLPAFFLFHSGFGIVALLLLAFTLPILRVAMPAASSPPPPPPVADDSGDWHYIYTTPPGGGGGPGGAIALTALATSAPQIQVVNHDFETHFMNAVSSGPFLCQIVIGDRAMSNVPIHSALHFGVPGAPLPLLKKLNLRINDTLLMNMIDISNADNTIYPAFTGLEKNARTRPS
jgi:hypothetical protein